MDWVRRMRTNSLVPLHRFLLNFKGGGSVNQDGVPCCFPKLKNGYIRKSMRSIRTGGGFTKIASRESLVGRSTLEL